MCISDLSIGTSVLQRIHQLLKSSALKLSLIPLAVISSTLLTAKMNAAYAISFKKNIDTYKNPTPSLMPDGLNELIDTVSKAIDFIENLPSYIKQYTIQCMSWIYDLMASVVLKTPLFIFDNGWIENSCLTFSLLSISLVTIFSIIESIKLSLRKKSTDFKKIMFRWFLVSGISGVMPVLFKWIFTLLNYVTDKIATGNSITMENVMFQPANGLDTLILIGFDVVMLANIIPLLLQNGRRYFDIMCLVSISPLALSAWIFDKHRHLFSQWLTSITSLSLVQIVYAFYLLILGLFMYGVPTPHDTFGIICKILVIIGAFSRMANPPNFVKRHLDQGGNISELFKSFAKTAVGVGGKFNFVKKYKTAKGKSDVLINKFKGGVK
jgi:hypothetical protein